MDIAARNAELIQHMTAVRKYMKAKHVSMISHIPLAQVPNTPSPAIAAEGILLSGCPVSTVRPCVMIY